MSAVTTARTAGAPAGPGPSLRGGLGRTLTVGLVLLLLIGAAAVGTYWTGDLAGGRADPTSTSPDGSAALVALLRDHKGVQVSTAASADQVPQGGETLVVGPASGVPTQALDRLRDRSRGAGRVVLLDPSPEVLQRFAPGVSRQDEVDGALRASCTTGDVAPGDTISGPARLYSVAGSTTGPAAVCFGQVGAGEGDLDQGALVTLTAAADRPETVVVGAVGAFTNAHLAELDDAGVALRLLGHGDRITWYTGLLESQDAPGAQHDDKLWPPPWLAPLTTALLGVVVALGLWRGRRLGRLVREPLPVVVAAHETTLARGRLYARGGDRAHAAGLLQRQALARMTRSLTLPTDAPVDLVVERVAQVTGRDAAQVRLALTHLPATDADLTALARSLTTLEKEVRRR